MQDWTRDGMVRDFDSCPVPRDKTGQSRKGRSKTGKGRSKIGKNVLKQENDLCSTLFTLTSFLLENQSTM